jgi:hypothetical protein
MFNLKCVPLWVLACAASLFGSRACWSQPIALSQDFDSGSLDVSASSVVGSNIRLVGRATWSDPFYADYYRWLYFRASGVQGQTPQFRVDESTFLGSLSGHRFVYSYDQSQWQFFDQGSFSGADYVFQNNLPFQQNEVYVAYALPYAVARTTERISAWRQSPYVTRTSSSSSDLLLGYSAAGLDDSGRFVPPQPLYGLRVTDPTATGPKQKVVLASGAHSAETTGNHVLEGMVDFLLSDDLSASQLRSRAEFYIYPQVNPAGRFAGYYRSNPENPSKDYNRYFNNPSGFTDLSIITAAMRADTASDVDYIFDFHSWWGPWSDDNFVFTVSNQVNSPFLQSLLALEPTLDVVSSPGSPGMLRIWGMSPSGLNAEFAYTPEFGFHPFVHEERYDTYGRNFALALRNILGTPVACDLNADLACNLADIDLLTSLGDLTLGLVGLDPKFDLSGDGIVNQQDLSQWLSRAALHNGLSGPYLPGDANLDAVVDHVDFAAWFDARFSAGTVWHQGDFNGDRVVDGLDFGLWNTSREEMVQRLGVTIPEPTAGWLLVLAAVLARSRSAAPRSFA